MADGLPLAFSDRAGAGYQIVAPRRPQIIDLELARQSIAAKSDAARESQRIVGKITQHASMDETMLLPVTVGNAQPYIGMIGADGYQFRPYPPGKRLGVENFSRKGLQVRHGRLSWGQAFVILKKNSRASAAIIPCHGYDASLQNQKGARRRPPAGAAVSGARHRDDQIEHDKGGGNCQQRDGLGNAYGETTGDYQSQRKDKKKRKNSLRHGYVSFSCRQ